MKKLLVFTTILVFTSSAFGQTYNTFEPSKTQFMLRGYGHTGFEYMDSGDETESTFLGSAQDARSSILHPAKNNNRTRTVL